uniref:NADH dehydrogenase subunit 4L n=1 Tax=Acavomonas peruviana TaxID=1542312 RepID=V5KVL1_9ALVE|nr:NADH dehydrogenase subunit 4L [Acavomonas peruviana]AHA41679.1 NADH dehydrogenase subunit 4L [Acavomonas peruviana]
MYFVGNFMFFTGLFGIIINKRSLIVIAMCLEVMLLGISVLFGFFSMALDDFFGQIMIVFIIALAGAETAIGLSLIVVYFKLRGSISINSIKFLKG